MEKYLTKNIKNGQTRNGYNPFLEDCINVNVFFTDNNDPVDEDDFDEF